MNVKLCVLSAGALFFLGQGVSAQKVKKDTIPNATNIEEIVVTGYQKKSKDEVTSAISVVSGKSLSNLSSSTMGTNALQGKAAGVDIAALNGKPGGGSAINIRGLGNITTSVGASNPLFVIDGFIVGNDQRAQDVFNSINPNDYESLSVLKDAAAAAIYGSQGANGVIVLTTKSGKSGKPVITLSSRMGFSDKIKDINFSMMNSAEKINYEKQMYALGIPGYIQWSDQATANALALDHNWQKSILRTSYIESYQVAVRGGNEKSKYTISLGYDSDNGIVENIHAYKRYTGRMKYEASPTDRLSFGSSLGVNYSMSQEIRDRNNTQNPFRAMYDYNSFEPVYRQDGSYNPTRQGFPILEALKNNPENINSLILDGNVFAQYKIIDGLNFKTQLGGYYNNIRRTSKILRGSFLDNVLGINGSVVEQNQNRFRYTNSNTLNYVKSFGNHSFDLLALIEYTEFRNDYISGTGRNFSSPSLSELGNASTPFAIAGYDELYRTFSYGGFLTYDFSKKYILTASIRQDKDSRFGKNNVSSEPFWSLSGAWNVTNEDFAKNSTILSLLKLRASIGTRGYNNINLNLNNILMSGGIYGTFPTIVSNANYGNPDLKWEVTKSQNYGAEFGFLKNRIKGTIDYFIDKKKDFILSIPNFSSEGGAYSTNINAGDLSNKGLEISLSADIIKSANFNWSVRANTSIMSYKLNKLRNGETERIYGINILREGYEPFSFFLVKSAGINPNNGNEVYYTKDGNTTEIYNSNDAVLIDGKSPLPNLFGGFGTSLNYKGFDLQADFTYKSGNYTYNYMALNMLNYSNGTNSNMRSDAANYWTAPGQTNVLPRPSNPTNAPGGITGLQTTDRFLQDASFIRLRNVSIGYTIDKKTIGETLPVNKIRISLTGQNLATWTKFEGDPEVSIGSGENQTGTGQTFINGAFALYSYPAVKTYLFGIELEF
ncbi:SusC/RagA family TonB-linked outer membrane protein [Chryseobacterium phosphatilyticum]|uniref:SusC/RagA family TonB-linked outer membrane protein n=1 Tax=Chryseobacterium phosphatilyticum TaxID=475075 RepID=A0A316X9X4_9FLAO|nr:SusC/RagA family TonB-linked outer membrane protein [Chryseobacterium phosphatilyticum]PWN70552.1 SusC/RagA family TonB-linked outer membrane protein [Chryseobacterium phosphatilyticum]